MKRSLTLIGSLATVAVVVAILVGVLTHRATPNRGRVPTVSDPEQALRLSGAIQAESPTAAADAADHVVFTPDSGKIRSIWIDENGDVTEVFADGLTVLTQTPQFGSDPEAYYEAVVKDAARKSVYLVDINGTSALAVEPNTDTLGTDPGLVRIELEGYSVVLQGPDFTVKELQALAQDLQPVK